MSKQRNRKPLTHKEKAKRDERNERRHRKTTIWKNKTIVEDPNNKLREMFLSPLRESKKTRKRREFTESLQKQLDEVDPKGKTDDQAS